MKKLFLSQLFFVSLSGYAGFSIAADPLVSPAEFQQAVVFFKKHSEPREIERFERQSAAGKAMLLGGAYWRQATTGRKQIQTGIDSPTSHDLARRLLLQAASNLDTLSQVEKAYVFVVLGQIDQVRGNRSQAEANYRRSMGLGNEEACVNLGAMWEEAGEYDKALSIYHGCLPDLKSSVLFMNLGSIYYNGYGRPRDHAKGSDYWQQSYVLFGYDPDVNYNLGLHHFQDTGNLDKARYHFVLSEAMDDSGARDKLNSSKLRKRDATKQFADDLLKADEMHRRWTINDRLHYTLDDRALTFPKNGLTFHQEDQGNRLVLSGKVKDPAAIKQALVLMFRLLYVDRLAFQSEEIPRLQDALIKHGEAELVKHGIRHKVSVGQDQQFSYEVRFD